MTLATVLRPWESFSHFSDEQLEQLAPALSRSRFPAGVEVLRQGDPTQEAYAIESGEVVIQRQTGYGSFELARVGAGEIFGETCFIDGGERSGDVVTAAESQLLAFNPVALRALVEEDLALHLALYWAFWKGLSGKLRGTNDRLTRFFGAAGPPPVVEPTAPAVAVAGFRVGLSDKRKLFEEQRLSSLEINFLASLSRERKLAGDELIFRDGDAGDAMYVVLEGRVMISKFIPGAGEEALAFLERGDYFGEMALIDGKPRSADAKADAGGAVVLAIPREVLAGILDIKKVSSLRLLKLLCSLIARRLRELDDKLVGWFIISGGQWGVEHPPATPPR
ncbi:MAG TPA: cyclic nucleotide-binding domain-containing protein [Thermoanaerobaculia bacterium]|nr:cyclic nucleotide-binding domain-containing protein [Thermoanaerobaculia bacterium]